MLLRIINGIQKVLFDIFFAASGVMLICGSFVLGKIIISKKWRKPRVEVTGVYLHLCLVFDSKT